MYGRTLENGWCPAAAGEVNVKLKSWTLRYRFSRICSRVRRKLALAQTLSRLQNTGGTVKKKAIILALPVSFSTRKIVLLFSTLWVTLWSLYDIHYDVLYLAVPNEHTNSTKSNCAHSWGNRLWQLLLGHLHGAKLSHLIFYCLLNINTAFYTTHSFPTPPSNGKKSLEDKIRLPDMFASVAGFMWAVSFDEALLRSMFTGRNLLWETTTWGCWYCTVRRLSVSSAKRSREIPRNNLTRSRTAKAQTFYATAWSFIQLLCSHRGWFLAPAFLFSVWVLFCRCRLFDSGDLRRQFRISVIQHHFNPFIPQSDQRQISPAASPEI